MTAKEYFRQAYRLDQKINSDLEEAAALREMAETISSPQLSERVQTSKKQDAPFVRCLEKIMDLERRIDEEAGLLVDLKNEMRFVISTVEDTDERMVLKYRYIHSYTWDRIAEELHADPRTVRRWHGNALQHCEMPENPVKI